jgi:RNA polymerase sigma-70 factor (ECF subfamily)
MRLSLCDDTRKLLDTQKLPVEETDLVRDAQKGDRQAFAALVERHWDGLYRWLYHLTHDRHAAEDLAQESFLKALKHVNSFRPGSNFRAWLFRIGHNAFVNQARRATRGRQPFPDDVATPEEGPAEQVITRESVELVAAAVSRLPMDFRAAFLLRVEEGLSFRQIADVLGLTEETARWRVFKARQKLLRVLTPQPDGEKP